MLPLRSCPSCRRSEWYSRPDGRHQCAVCGHVLEHEHQLHEVTHHLADAHLLDYERIGQLEERLYNERFHHESPRCRCRRCVKARLDQAANLNAQTRHGWEIQEAEHAEA